MIVFPEIGVQFHVFQKIVHPAHIPLKGKTQSAVFGGISHLRPGGGFLGNHGHAGVALVHNAVQMLEKFDGLQIFIAAVNIRHPLPVLFSVIQIEHRSDSVYPQSVHVEFLYPE